MTIASPRTDVEGLARVLANARVAGERLATLAPELRPASSEDAFATQYATLQSLGSAPAGWKIGSKSHDGPIQGAPMPAAGVHRGRTTVAREAFAHARARTGDRVPLRPPLRSRQRPVQRRGRARCDRDRAARHRNRRKPLRRIGRTSTSSAQLADLQNHGALIVGEGVAVRTRTFRLHRP